MRKRHLTLVGILLVFVPLLLQASCGSASCPLNNFRRLQAGFFRIGFSREYIDQDQIYIGSRRSFVGTIRGHHDEVQTINERSVVQLQVGILDRIGVNLDIPFISRQHSHIHRHQGQDLWESWSFSGLGDVVASAQFSLLLPGSEFDPYLSLVAGVKVPTGVTNIRNAEGEEAEVSIQPGSGSTDGIVGLYYRQTLMGVPTLSGDFSSLPIVAGFTYQFNGSGKDGWRSGNALLPHIGTSYQFAHHASFLLQINGRFQSKADVGTTGEPRENTGGIWLYVSPGLDIDLTEHISAFGYVQLPMYQNVNGIQQTSNFNLLLGISANAGLLE